MCNPYELIYQKKKKTKKKQSTKIRQTRHRPGLMRVSAEPRSTGRWGTAFTTTRNGAVWGNDNNTNSPLPR